MSLAKPLMSIEDADFEFENSPVQVIASRNCPVIELAGLKVGPFEEGSKHEVRFWVARELKKAGIARFWEEELLNAVSLHKIHWKERVQSVKRLSSLPEDFYSKLRRYLTGLKEESSKSAEKMREYEKSVRLAQDIVNCRLKKVVSLSSFPEKTNKFLQDLAMEERILYDSLHQFINMWRSKILKGVSLP
jgi:hypothetical protein